MQSMKGEQCHNPNLLFGCYLNFFGATFSVSRYFLAAILNFLEGMTTLLGYFLAALIIIR